MGRRKYSSKYEISEASSISGEVGDLLSHYQNDFRYFWTLCN
ncbi:hypothetical protein ERO13_D10G176266v2 [Gossypium hirsutum]|nr:hypothetical protein ERO13_D10G176266v2 [Gossypium hirsutum]